MTPAPSDATASRPGLSTPPPLSRGRLAALVAFCAAMVLLVPLHRPVAGAATWLIALALIVRTGDRPFRRRMGTLLGCLIVLAIAPIHTGTTPRHFVTLGVPFVALAFGPAWILRRSDPGVVRFRFWPSRLRWLDIGYVLLAFPLAWAILKLYFHIDPELPTHWYLPAQPDDGAIRRLFWGINGVGIWDELFFVNTVYAILRSVFPYRVANLAQAVVYTSVLYAMAFTGPGPVFVYFLAWTQGAMFEESESLLYVLLVHLIVDYFLFAAIVAHYYPGLTPAVLLH